MALAPLQVQAPIARRDVVVRCEPQPSRRAIDPRRRALQLQVDADRSFVQHRRSRTARYAKLRPILLVPEDGTVPQPVENRRHLLGVADFKLELFTALM